MASVDDIATAVSALNIHTNPEIVDEIRTKCGPLFSARRVKLVLKAIKHNQCIKCDAIFPTIQKLKQHIKKHKHNVGPVIKKRIKAFLKEQGFPQNTRLCNIANTDLSTRKNIADRDTLLAKRACYVRFATK